MTPRHRSAKPQRAVGGVGRHARARRRARLALLLLVLGLGGIAVAHTAARVVPRPLGSHGAWRLIFDDEFSASSLDTSRWSTGWFGSGITGGVDVNEPECYDPRQVSQTDGILALTLVARTETCGGRTHPYASGIITSNGKFSFTRGFIQVRAWLPPQAGGTIADWPGIWADSQNWPVGGELDVVEGLRGSACWHFHTATAAPGGCETVRGTRHVYAGGWHTYGANWQAGKVVYYYDGHRVGVIRGPTTKQPMYLVIGLGSTLGSVVAPSSLRVDYVRVWQR